MPQAVGRSRPWRDHRQVVEGIVFRYRSGVAWRDLPGRFGPWQTVWKRHYRFATDGTWDKLLRVIQAEADAAGRVDWNVSRLLDRVGARRPGPARLVLEGRVPRRDCALHRACCAGP